MDIDGSAYSQNDAPSLIHYSNYDVLRAERFTNDMLLFFDQIQMTALDAHGEGEAVKQNVYLMRNALQNSETTWDQ